MNWIYWVKVRDDIATLAGGRTKPGKTIKFLLLCLQRVALEVE